MVCFSTMKLGRSQGCMGRHGLDAAAARLAALVAVAFLRKSCRCSASHRAGPAYTSTLHSCKEVGVL
jgi:hypothetical protein